MKRDAKLIGIYFDDKGQGLIDYALIISLIALAVLGVMILFGDSVIFMYEIINNKISEI